MKLFAFTFFVASISFSWAAIPLPPGCGDAVVKACNAVKPFLSSEGKAGIIELNEGVDQVRNAIKNGDIQGLVHLFRSVGAQGMIKLSKTTTNACVRQAFLDLNKLDLNAANQLQSVHNPVKAGQISCNTFTSKAQRLNKCIKK